MHSFVHSKKAATGDFPFAAKETVTFAMSQLNSRN